MKSKFSFGYQFHKFSFRGKVFIDFEPAESAWSPVNAPGYNMINCFWVSGQYKGKGYGKALLDSCAEHSKDKNGLVAIASSKKQPFLNDKKFLEKNGFVQVDFAEPYFDLMCLRFRNDGVEPAFLPISKSAKCNESDGLIVYYTNACPFTEYYVNTELKNSAVEFNIPLEINKISTLDQARNHFVPFTIFSLFYKGNFLTHQILSRGMFEKLIRANKII